MKYRQHFVALALLLFCGSIVCQAPFNERQDFSEASAQQLMKQLNDIYWQTVPSYRNLTDDSLSPKILMRDKLRPIYATMQFHNWQQFQDPLLRRQFEIILRGAKYPPVDNNFKYAIEVLQSLSRRKWVCAKNNIGGKCNMAFIPQIKLVFTNTPNSDEIAYYWREWRNKMPNEVKEAFNYYVEYYKHKIVTTEKPSAVWYEEYDDPEFSNELEKLMLAIQPFYRELHAHLRYQLDLQYGPKAIFPTGKIPHHLLEQGIYQAWKKESVFQNPYPNINLPNLQAEINEFSYQPIDLINISLQFFGSLGFQNLSQQFMQQHFSELKIGSAGSNCKAKVFDYGEIELNYCRKVNYKKLLQSHGDIATVEYALAKNALPVGLNQEACPGFGNAIGEAAILSASNPKHIQKHLGMLHDYNYDDKLSLNRLYHLSIHTLLSLPTYFVHDKLWVDIIDGKITPAEYNCHYWNIMDQYMGVEAPVQTDIGAYDMPYKFYEGLVDQFRSTKKIFGEIFGYQIYRNLCLQTDEYKQGDTDKSLNKCDFTNSILAGQYLRQVMSAGATKPWRDLVGTFSTTGKAELSADAILEYFQPVLNWLTEDNKKKGLKPGWTTTEHCRRA